MYWGRNGFFFKFAVLKWSVPLGECGRFVVQRSPRGRLGSVLDVGNRLHRMRRRLGYIYQFSQQSSSLKNDLPMSLAEELIMYYLDGGWRRQSLVYFGSP